MEYILIDLDQQPSRLNGVRMWRLTFYCLDDGTVWEMTVDNSYVNFKRSGWDHVVEDPHPYGVYRDLQRTQRLTARGIPVVSADSRAKCILELEDQNTALELVEIDQIMMRRPGNNFHVMFALNR
jgi:hypothetical protein